MIVAAASNGPLATAVTVLTSPSRTRGGESTMATSWDVPPSSSVIVSSIGVGVRMPRPWVTVAEIVTVWFPSSAALSTAVMVGVSVA